MRAVIATMLLSLVLPSASWAASPKCDQVREIVSRSGPPRPDLCKGKIEDQLACLKSAIARQSRMIALLKCELDQIGTTRIRPL